MYILLNKTTGLWIKENGLKNKILNKSYEKIIICSILHLCLWCTYNGNQLMSANELSDPNHQNYGFDDDLETKLNIEY